MSDSNRNSASSFTLEEEAFFRAGSNREPTEPVERFSDLDEGPRPPSLWQRLFGRRPAHR